MLFNWVAGFGCNSATNPDPLPYPKAEGLIFLAPPQGQDDNGVKVKVDALGVITIFAGAMGKG